MSLSQIQSYKTSLIRLDLLLLVYGKLLLSLANIGSSTC